MSELSEQERRQAETRRKIIGLGGGSQRKSYYPQLQERIAELERANRALAESEEKYRTLVENVGVGIFRTPVDPRQPIAQANQAMALMLGYDSVDELLARTPADLYPDPSKRPDLLARLDGAEGVREFKAKVRRKDGSTITGLLTLTPQRGPFGTIEWIDGVLVDITEQEEARRRIEEDHARLRTIFDTLPVGIVLVDRDGRAVGSNRQAQEVMRRKVPFRDVDDLSPDEGWKGGKRLGPQDWPLARSLRGETVVNEEVEVLRGDGSRAIILASSAPILDPSEGIIGGVLTLVDITETKRLQQEVEDARARAELYVDLLTHDISNYNAAAMGYLQLAEERLPLEERDRRLITKPLEELRNSSELVANVWDLQRVEAGREEHGPVDVCRLLEEVKAEHESVPGRDVRITLHQEKGCMVMASELLSVAFSNIVSNAIKHSEGAVDIDITVRPEIREGKPMVRVEVADNGPGIPDERKPAVFNRSMLGLTKWVSRGLGLHLVKRLVEEHGGSVWVEDRVPGDHTKGARFVVLLPEVPADEERVAVTASRS